MRRPSRDHEAQVTPRARNVLDGGFAMWRLASMRGPSENLSDVIVRTAASGGII
jgi:hypothetical protein